MMLINHKRALHENQKFSRQSAAEMEDKSFGI